MPMFVVIFLMLCVIAQPQAPVQPVQNAKITAESATKDDKNTILFHINDAGNCSAYEHLKSEPNYLQLKECCERPLPGTPSENRFLSYEMVLCMVLYDAAQRVCKVGHQERTKGIQNFSGNFSCNTMIEGVPETLAENTKPWVRHFKAKFINISDCEQACMQDDKISPVCEYIWKANTLTYQAPVSSAISADISPTENSQLNSKGHGKTNKIMTSKDKSPNSKASGLPFAADPSLSKLNNGGQNTEQVEHKKTLTIKSAVNKDVDHAEANGNSTQSSSANDVNNNVKGQAYTKNSSVQTDLRKQAQATVNTGHNAKTQSHTADSKIQNNINKQAHGTNSNVQSVMKKQELAINNSNHLAEVTPHSSPASLSVYTERTSEAVKYHDSTGKSISSDSKSNTAQQPENKSSAGDASDRDMENQNDDNEDIIMTTEEHVDNDQYTDMAGNIRSGAEDQEEDKINSDRQEEQSDQILQIEAHEEEADTGSTAQFNQLGDAADSHFYAYFMTMVVVCIIGYLVFHNKQKILALALEGRSRRGTRRRPNTSAYRKLDSNLEEAVTSTGSSSVTHVIY